MLTYHLKFESEEQASVVLFNEDVHVYPNTDVIGLIYKEDNSNPKKPVVTMLDGFHVNVYSEVEIPELNQYRVEVKSPVRVVA